VAATPAGGGGWRSYRIGLLTNLLNPKVGLFYVTLLPQLIPAGVPVAAVTAVFAAIHIGFGMTWLCVVAAAVGRLGPVLRGAAGRRRIEQVTGGVLLAPGLRLAFSPWHLPAG